MALRKKTKTVTCSMNEIGMLLGGRDEEERKRIAKDLRDRITEVPEKHFENLSELLTWCNITPKEFSKRTGYNYRAIVSWTKGKKIPKNIRDRVLSVTVSYSPSVNGYWEEIRLGGEKISFENEGKVLTLDEQTMLIGKKPKSLSRDIWNQSKMIDNDTVITRLISSVRN